MSGEINRLVPAAVAQHNARQFDAIAEQRLKQSQWGNREAMRDMRAVIQSTTGQFMSGAEYETAMGMMALAERGRR